MEIQWYGDETVFDSVILAGDVGGTNTSLALVGKRGRDFSMTARFLFRSRELPRFSDALDACLSHIHERLPGLRIDRCCIAGAGPVQANRCSLTNLSWNLSGLEIEERFGVRTVIINDFSAICYGLPLLDTGDPSQIVCLPHPDGSLPSPSGAVRAVVGAGTGLGVGYLIEDHGRYVACASEGGHSDFSPFDEDSRAMHAMLAGEIGAPPGTELFVSGQGILNAYRYFTGPGGLSCANSALAAAADSEKPALIAAGADTDELCGRIMRLFVQAYARFSSNSALQFLPTAGLFLAGGIVAKNIGRFLADELFMRSFEANYNKNIVPVLRTIPVYIVRDYAVSLYGAAHAAYCLL